MDLSAIYRSVFKTRKEEDYERLEFLERVVTGKMPYGNQLIDVEDVIELEGLEYAMFQGFDYQTERHLGEIEAIRKTREWYKRFGSTIPEGKEQIGKFLMNAELTSVLETLDDCLEVLKKYREETEFLSILKAAEQCPKRYRTSAVYAAAETLLDSITNPDSRKEIYEFVEKYEGKLIRKFNRAARTGKIIQIADAYMELSLTHEPEVMEYARKALRH